MTSRRTIKLEIEVTKGRKQPDEDKVLGDIEYTRKGRRGIIEEGKGYKEERTREGSVHEREAKRNKITEKRTSVRWFKL